jgi:hypothetical protein
LIFRFFPKSLYKNGVGGGGGGSQKQAAISLKIILSASQHIIIANFSKEMFINFVSQAAEHFLAKNLLLKNTPSLSEPGGAQYFSRPL